MVIIIQDFEIISNLIKVSEKHNIRLKKIIAEISTSKKSPKCSEKFCASKIFLKNLSNFSFENQLLITHFFIQDFEIISSNVYITIIPDNGVAELFCFRWTKPAKQKFRVPIWAWISQVDGFQKCVVSSTLFFKETQIT